MAHSNKGNETMSELHDVQWIDNCTYRQLVCGQWFTCKTIDRDTASECEDWRTVDEIDNERAKRNGTWDRT